MQFGRIHDGSDVRFRCVAAGVLQPRTIGERAAAWQDDRAVHELSQVGGGPKADRGPDADGKIAREIWLAIVDARSAELGARPTAERVPHRAPFVIERGS